MATIPDERETLIYNSVGAVACPQCRMLMEYVKVPGILFGEVVAVCRVCELAFRVELPRVPAVEVDYEPFAAMWASKAKADRES